MAEEEKHGETEPPAAPPPRPPTNPLFQRMMAASRKRGIACATKPRGPVPAGMKWDGYADGGNGKWVPIEPVAEDDADDSSPAPARARRHRTFQESAWMKILPTLICVCTLASGTTCSMDAKCPGCAQCAKLYCTECQNDGSSNAFVAGSRAFHANGIILHKARWHRARIGSDIAEGLAKTIDAHKEKIKGVMRNVLWLAKEKIALGKLASLCDLVALHGVALGKHYVNHVAARDFALSIAHVLRMRIINAARVSPALGLMVDESTDVGKHGNSILYLRLLMGGVFVTVFYRIVQVSDATAEGLATLITETFEQDGLPKSRLYSFASDGASVMTGAENGVAARLRDLFCLFVRARGVSRAPPARASDFCAPRAWRR